MLAVVIPWRFTSARLPLLRAVQAEYQSLFPDAPVLLADDMRDMFNRAGSRNAGVALAEQAGADTVVIGDADTLPDETALSRAVEAASDGRVHLPYDRVCADGPPGEPATYWPNSTGGILVCRIDTYHRAGGQDPRFTGWGFEDAAFGMAVATLIGDMPRHSGTIRSLYHKTDRDPKSTSYNQGLALCRRYERACGNAELMSELIGERSD